MTKRPAFMKTAPRLQRYWLYLTGILAGLVLLFLAAALVFQGSGEPLTLVGIIQSHKLNPVLWLVDAIAALIIILMLIGIIREQKHTRRIVELQDKIAQRIGELYNLKDIYHREIHQRQQAEINITRAKREWESTFDTIPDLILLTDSYGKIVRCNQATIQKLECAYEDILGKPIEEVFPGVVEPIKKHVISKTQVIPMPSKYGWFDVTGRQFQFLDDKPGMIYIFHDIAERKSSEAELQRQKQYFEAIFQNSPVAIVTIDLSNRIVTSNPAFEYLFGYSAAEAAGRKLDELILPPEYHNKTIEYTRRIHRIDVHHEVSRRLTRRGEPLDVEIFTVPVVVSNEPLGTLVLFHNITDLVQARRKAEKADIAKSAFLANISHEIRTPLNGLIGLLNMTLDTTLSPTQVEYLSTAADQAEELLSLLNEILDLSKIEAGRMQLEFIPFDLRTVMENIALTMAQRASEKDIEFVCIIPTAVPAKLRGDPNRLRQVLSNLASNAVRFTEQGEVVLGVQLVTDDGYGAKLNFSVQDTGIGIPADRQASIFERFTQADQSTTRKYGGTGLGLSISAQIVELMGGKISLKSEPGNGSTFSFTVHFEKLSENEPPSEALLERSQGLKVLALDPNQNTCVNLQYLLEELECRAVTTTSSEEAQTLIELPWSAGEPFHLLIADARLVSSHDYAFLRALRTNPADQPVKIIVLNRIGDTIDEVLLEKLGVGGIGLKPVRRQPLHNLLYDVLSQEANKSKRQPQSRGKLKTLKTARAQKILLAEDNPTNRKVVTNLLEKFGHTVHTVENGRQAVEAFQEEGYNLLLMDLTMPELDGHEAVSRIRRMEGKDHHTPVIALSGHTSDLEVQRCLSSGMDACLFKPVKPEELFETVEKWAKPASNDRLWMKETEESPQNISAADETPQGDEIDELEFAEFSSAYDQFVPSVHEADPENPPADLAAGRIMDVGDSLDQERIEITPSPFGSPEYMQNILPRFGGDASFFIRTFEEFILDCHSHLVEIQRATEQKDAVQLELLAHNLKGVAANFEVESLTKLAQELESQVGADDLSHAGEIAAAMEREIPLLENYLAEVRSLR